LSIDWQVRADLWAAGVLLVLPGQLCVATGMNSVGVPVDNNQFNDWRVVVSKFA
jgi:hypothetical protein